jgi:hypothetical protein
MIPTYNKPTDIFEKLLREARRTRCANDHTEASDHFYNYCVTCVSLRDWVIKYLCMNSQQKSFYQKRWRKNDYFGICADIANSSKHFGLDYERTSSVTSVTTYTAKLLGLSPNGIVPGYASERPHFKIVIDGKMEIHLIEILFMSCKNWEQELNDLSIMSYGTSKIDSAFIDWI